MSLDRDRHFMRSALDIARRGAGRTGENPTVGCVIVNDQGVVLARERTADGGRPHAEAQAIQKIPYGEKNLTAYVTLEPCAHLGQTPPCAHSLAESRSFSRVVIGAIDPDPRVSSKGVQILKDAGILVSVDVLGAECREHHAPFMTGIEKKRPFVTLKAGCTLDGKIAVQSGQSKWITGEIARRHVHILRAQHDAILVGIGTILADDSSLSVRAPVFSKSLVKVVLDTHLRIPVGSNLFKDQDQGEIYIFYCPECVQVEKLEMMKTFSHVTCIPIDPHDLSAVLSKLNELGIRSILVEGGASVHSAFIRHRLYHQIAIYRAPKILGGKAIDIFREFEMPFLENAPYLDLQKTYILGDDLLEIYKPRE